MTGGALGMTGEVLGMTGKRIFRSDLLVALGVTAVVLLIIPEVLYVKDIYTTHQRANTMFKLTYQAFIMMSLVFGWVVGKLLNGFHLGGARNQGTTLLRLDSRKGPPRRYRAGLLLGSNPYRLMNRLALGVVVVLWGWLMVFPVKAFSSYYGEFRKYKGLDGLEWLKKDEDKWGAVEYLEKNRDGKNMIEAVGDSYSKLNSVSAFSGTPTVMGWRVHEWLWRGGYGVVREREQMVKSFYETGDKTILEKFGVGWILVGVDERKEYKVNENKILELGEVVWSGEGGYLIKMN